MAKTTSDVSKYSLYDGREIAGPAINWGTVAADTAKTLKDIATDRLDRRQKIDDDTAEAMNQLSQVELGSSTNMNTVLIDGSAASKETLSNAYQLVKQGLLSPKDFAMMMQKQKDGYTNLSTWAKSYNNEYEAALERVNSGEAAGIEESLRMTAFKFGNMTNKKLMSDPVSGELVMVDLVKDDSGNYVVPNYSENKGKFLPPQDLLNMSKYQQNSIVLTDAVAENVTKNLASVITSELSSRASRRLDGKDLTEVTDFRQLFEDSDISMTNDDGSKMSFADFLRAEAEGVGNSDQALAEILYKAGQIDFNYGEGTSGGKEIFVTMENGEPTYDLSEDQKEQALRLIENEINSQLDKEIKKQKGFAGTDAPRDPVRDRENKKEEEEDDANLSYLEQINTLLTGDLTAANNEARDLIADFNKNLSDEERKTKGIRGVVVTKNTIRVRYNNGEEYEVQRFEVDDQDQRSQRAVSEDALGLFNRIVSGKTLTKKKLKGYIDNEDIEFGDVREDPLSFRNKQKPIPISFINKSGSPELDNKAPIPYLRGRLGEDTGNNWMGTIGKDMRKVFTSMLDPTIITVNDNQGYPNPLNSFKVVDEVGNNSVSFELGGEKTTIYFDNARTPEEMVKELEDGILKGIKKLNEKRGKQTLDTQLSYEEWMVDTKENPSGDTTLAGFMEWISNN